MPPFEATFKHGLLLREGFLAPRLLNSGVHAGSCASFLFSPQRRHPSWGIDGVLEKCAEH